MSTTTTGKVWVFRREGIPFGTTKDGLRQSFPPEIRDQIEVTSLSPGINLNERNLTATFSLNARLGDELLLSEDKDFYGFTPLYSPEGEVEADIIAITGLAGHAFGSWAAPPHMWLRDFLPNDLPTARVLLYGYDSKLAGSQSRNILSDLSNNFVVKFHTMRSLSGSEHRPIILIGHSLGCLIIKDALIEMKSLSVHHQSQSQPNLKAVILFGAPHRGLNVTAMQSIMNGTPSAELIRELEWQSPTIQRLNNGFRHLCEGLDMLSIYEKKPTATLRVSSSGGLERTGPLEMMVDKDSALLYLHKEIHLGLDQDHSRIAKVDCGQNGCYDEIVHFIRQSISSASKRGNPQQSYPELSTPTGSVLQTAKDPRPGLPSFDPRPLKAPKSHFVVPFGRDDSFIDRIEIFNHINEHINKHAKHHRLALSGIGGVGKSQIAIEYCYRYQDDHPHAHIFWVHASTRERFDQAYREIARRLELTGWNDPNVDTLRLVSNWFNEADDETWLMVLDNADDLDLFFTRPVAAATDGQYTPPLVDYLPQNSKGLMLITTRDERVAKRLAGIHASIVVNPMSPSEAQELLEIWQTNLAGSSDDGQSTYLLEALGYIPLAITQAAALINENQITLTKYLETFCASDSDLQDVLDEDLGDHRRDSKSQSSVIKTWKMSFDLISNQKPRAAEMLSLMAVLDRQGIPESLLRNASDRNTDFTTALGTLQAFSLIKAGSDGAGYEMHRLVQLATQKWLEIRGTIEKWREKALVMVADMFPRGEFKNWTTCESLLPHAQKVLEHQVTNEVYQSKVLKLLRNVASFDFEQGRYATACVRYLVGIEVDKKVFGSEHPFTLISMHNLALSYKRHGQSEKAERLQVQVLETQKKVLGAEHPHTLTSMHNLAAIYREQGQWEEAEKLQLEVLEARKGVLGTEHPHTLNSMNNLALTYKQQGRLEKAEKLQLEVLEVRKGVLGAKHPDTLTSMDNLALTYQKQGRLKEAEKLQLEVLEARKRVQGAEHPDTLISMSNLAITYQAQGRLEEVEEMQMEVLEARKRVLGAEHPDTLISMHNLAVVYSKQDRHNEAISLMKSVVELRTKILGENHPATIDSTKWLEGWLDT